MVVGKINIMKTISYSLLVLLVSSGFQLSYADDCIPWNNDFSGKSNLSIGKINIIAGDIFDSKISKENGVIHRLANKIHIQTKPSIVKSQLLFSEGDRFEQEKLVESERNLRRQRYIKSASIKPYVLCGNRVSIRVKTHDNWTLTPGLSFSRQGGENDSGIAIEEHNLFGLGKSLSFNYKKDAKRNSKLFSYEDPQLFGTRNRLVLDLQNNTDGTGYGLTLEHPFYELDSKYSWGFKSSKLKQETTLYQSGITVDKITEEKQNTSIFYGWSKKPHEVFGSPKNNKVLRFKVGWTIDKTDFLESARDPQFKATSLKESYPWIEFNSLHENYIEKTNYKTMGKIEDVSLGQSITVGIGLLNKSFGSDDNQLKLSAKYRKGYLLKGNNLGFLSVESGAYIGSGKRQGETISFQGDIDHFNKRGNDFSLKAGFKIANNLTVTEQLVLGGGMGLRAYPNAYQTGDKSILFQAEKRIHFDWYPLHLVKFAAVVFADAGTAWGKGNNTKMMADIGVGLRLFPTRSSTGKAVHINLAMPLIDRNKVKKYQFSIGTSQTF
jgi:outer membrane protein assembly factor BamA